MIETKEIEDEMTTDTTMIDEKKPLMDEKMMNVETVEEANGQTLQMTSCK